MKAGNLPRYQSKLAEIFNHEDEDEEKDKDKEVESQNLSSAHTPDTKSSDDEDELEDYIEEEMEEDEGGEGANDLAQDSTEDLGGSCIDRGQPPPSLPPPTSFLEGCSPKERTLSSSQLDAFEAQQVNFPPGDIGSYVPSAASSVKSQWTNLLPHS